MFDNFVSSQIGLVHLLMASVALIFGSFVLADAKGTVFYRRVGYLYALSMLGLNITALDDLPSVRQIRRRFYELTRLKCRKIKP